MNSVRVIKCQQEFARCSGKFETPVSRHLEVDKWFFVQVSILVGKDSSNDILSTICTTRVKYAPLVKVWKVFGQYFLEHRSSILDNHTQTNQVVVVQYPVFKLVKLEMFKEELLVFLVKIQNFFESVYSNLLHVQPVQVVTFESQYK